MKKICFFSGNINKSGGTERVGLLIANALANRNYDVSILSYENGEAPFFYIDDKINLYSLHMEKHKGFISRKLFPYIKLYKFLKNKPQNIIINIDVLLGLYSIPMKFFTNIKVIAWEHFNCLNNNGVKNRDKARKLSGKYASAIITLTYKDKQLYKDKYKIKCYIDFIFNPSVSLLDKKCKKENIVLACGRLSYTKNFQELIEIWRSLGKKTDNWKLIICGEGEDRKELEELIEGKNIKNVFLPGNKSDMAKMYNSSKIMVMTSRFEGLPMVLLEAQGCGLPIVSYDCNTGPSEIVCNGDNGYLIEYGNKKLFAEKLINLMNNDEIIKKMGQNALEHSKVFNIDNIIDKWEKLFIKLDSGD